MAEEQSSIAMPEKWRDIPGYEGAYQVSDHGRVQSLDRPVIGKSGSEYIKKGKLLKLAEDKWGHLAVGLSCNAASERRRVHALVMEAFVGPRPEGMETRHLNGIPNDNRLTNLRYGTRSENAMDMVLHGGHHQARKSRCIRGHLLLAPNLLTGALKRGGRSCKSCIRARNYMRSDPSLNMQIESDREYLKILEEYIAG